MAKGQEPPKAPGMTLNDLYNFYVKAKLIEDAVARDTVPTVEFRFNHGQYPEDAPNVAHYISDIQYSVAKNVFIFFLEE